MTKHKSFLAVSQQYFKQPNSMSSDVADQRRDYVLAVLCGVLGLSVTRGQDHLLNFINTHDDVKKEVDEIASLFAGPLNVFTSDELEV